MSILVVSVLVLAAGYIVHSWNGAVTGTMAPVYHGSAWEKKMALTFNVVWGEEYIAQILETLKESNVPATFFIGGQWAEDFPELAKEIARAGHEIGSHGYSHPHPDRISKTANIHEIQKTEEVLKKVTGVKPVLFAPPYGERGEVVLKAAEEAGYTTILWSIDTIDWQRPDPSVILKRVTEKAHNGGIVLMHPTAPTVHALPQMIQELKKQGYELVRVSALLEGLKNEAGPEKKNTGS
ncbi:MAG: polysaccharide deacetylase family protein [Firmicutes bacterium]|nr:polysaccharide deacetylase family protein [Bacillota bacterium]